MDIVGSIRLQMIPGILSEYLLCFRLAETILQRLLYAGLHGSRIIPGIPHLFPGHPGTQLFRPFIVFFFLSHMRPAEPAHHGGAHRILRLPVAARCLPHGHQRE